MQILVSIPVYASDELHLDFTEETLNSIKSIHKHEIIIVNNYCKPELLPRLQAMSQGKAKVINNPKGNALSASWNLGIKYGLINKADYILTINNDIVFHPEAIDNLVKFAAQHKEFVLWTGAEYESLRDLQLFKPTFEFDEHPHFSCFLTGRDFNRLLAEKEKSSQEPYPGYFDENLIPAYFEDADMHNRILRAGFKAAKTASARFYHYGSRTIKVDEELNHNNFRTYENNREYIKRKWGWDPHNCILENDSPERFKYQGPFEP